MVLTVAQILFTLAMYALGAALFGLAAFPGVWFAHSVWVQGVAWPTWARLLAVCLAGAVAFFLFGLGLILLVAILRVLLRLDLQEGEHAMFSAGAIVPKDTKIPAGSVYYGTAKAGLAGHDGPSREEQGGASG